MGNRLTDWRFRRYLRTLPPIVARDPDYLLTVFRRDIGRDFNVWSREDRETIAQGVRVAIVRALPALFPGRAALAQEGGRNDGF